MIYTLQILCRRRHSVMEPLAISIPPVDAFVPLNAFDAAAAALVNGDPIGLEQVLTSAEVSDF
jgi:hypothetical protein